MWKFSRFEELSNRELFDIYELRVAVFVVEQACPYQEVDRDDLSCYHLTYYQENQLQAYCRLIVTDHLIKLGRVIVSKESRGKGVGHELVQQALNYANGLSKDKPVYAQAQAYLKDFYASFGFEARGEIYLEDQIPHIDMYRENTNKK